MKLVSNPRRKSIRLLTLLVAASFALFLLAACGGSDDVPEFDPESSLIASIEISSVAFEDGSAIPVEFTCDGENTSPPLRWSDVPAGTRSIAIVVDDPDASSGIFRHWSVFNIPSGTRSIAANQPATQSLKDSRRQAKNDFGNVGYGGPCPPTGQEHEYVFFIYALSEQLELEGGVSPNDVSAALRGKVVGTGSFSGMYARR
ncbi:YbhB/YbcL family Raf kinase inhibitor-like protein [Candidatus Lucifugimonas marina]|uniref:YbhB/YbcL family Raf kinase inhibitor-like protein n=1 Tax=Candidatus Lucifugimonas marina TaxID=3038979 RepID=UPI00319DF23D